MITEEKEISVSAENYTFDIHIFYDVSKEIDLLSQMLDYVFDNSDELYKKWLDEFRSAVSDDFEESLGFIDDLGVRVCCDHIVLQSFWPYDFETKIDWETKELVRI